MRVMVKKAYEGLRSLVFVPSMRAGQAPVTIKDVPRDALKAVVNATMELLKPGTPAEPIV